MIPAISLMSIIIRTWSIWRSGEGAPSSPTSWAERFDTFLPEASKAHRFVCGTPHVWAEEQQQAAEWELSDQAQSYDGKFYSGDDAKGVMAAWRDGVRKQ